jgi:3-hydroxyisobutyrate dehydrogenase-like beta-hydroxyacid dehydrogenase
MMSESNESQHVCVIGLGNMGSALADALITSGHRVTVWNRTASKCEALAEAGASVAASIPEAAAEAQVIVVCVINHDASVSLLQTDEVASALRGRLLVQLSTVTAEESRDMGRWAEENGIAYLDGAILATPSHIRANAGEPIVYSGPRALFDANASVLTAMGGNPIFVGEVIGGAPTFDKTIYANYYGSMLAFFHGAAICHAAGFPIETYVDQAYVSESTRRHLGEMIVKRSYGDVSVASIELDVAAYEQVTKLSEELGIDAAFPRTVASYLDRAIAKGHGQQELAAIFELMVPRNA